jgi:hypothetical protein
MPFSLFVSLAVLGLSAVDPVGIAIMPVLLTQKRPMLRAWVFLLGSFVSLMIMGLAFALGFGHIVLRLETEQTWLLPTIEMVAGGVLFVTGIVMLVRLLIKRQSTGKPPRSITERLQVGALPLFLFGAGLVAVQSIIDVVFVVAMIRTGQERLYAAGLVAAVATYAAAALAIQIGIVVVYQCTPPIRRTQMLASVHHGLSRSSNQLVTSLSIAIGTALFVNGFFMFLGLPHL